MRSIDRILKYSSQVMLFLQVPIVFDAERTVGDQENERNYVGGKG